MNTIFEVATKTGGKVVVRADEAGRLGVREFVGPKDTRMWSHDSDVLTDGIYHWCQNDLLDAICTALGVANPLGITSIVNDRKIAGARTITFRVGEHEQRYVMERLIKSGGVAWYTLRTEQGKIIPLWGEDVWGPNFNQDVYLTVCKTAALRDLYGLPTIKHHSQVEQIEADKKLVSEKFLPKP
jgi:hypothetical protein